MKTNSVLSKIGISICIIGIVLVMINYFTGFINPKMTTGASAICFSSFIIVLSYIFTVSKAKKNK